MKHLTCMAALAAALAVAAPAGAQLAPDSDAPVDITADELEVVNAECSSTWRGDAEALQGNARLKANVLRTYFEKSPGATRPNCGGLERLEAEGSVYYATPQQRVRANAAVYNATTETLVMTGNVVAAQGLNVVRGDRLVINTRTGQGQMSGGAGDAKRPRGVFYPNQPASSPGQ